MVVVKSDSKEAISKTSSCHKAVTFVEPIKLSRNRFEDHNSRDSPEGLVCSGLVDDDLDWCTESFDLTIHRESVDVRGQARQERPQRLQFMKTRQSAHVDSRCEAPYSKSICSLCGLWL